jgi:CheY-like chemotaxis protein
MNFFKQEGLYVDVPPPDLILLDLNLPKKSSLEVLGEINSAPKLKMIPVVIMTTSAADEEILKSYALLYRFRLHGHDRVKVNNSRFHNGRLPTDDSPSRTV